MVELCHERFADRGKMLLHKVEDELKTADFGSKRSSNPFKDDSPVFHLESCSYKPQNCKEGSGTKSKIALLKIDERGSISSNSNKINDSNQNQKVISEQSNSTTNCQKERSIERSKEIKRKKKVEEILQEISTSKDKLIKNKKKPSASEIPRSFTGVRKSERIAKLEADKETKIREQIQELKDENYKEKDESNSKSKKTQKSSKRSNNKNKTYNSVRNQTSDADIKSSSASGEQSSTPIKVKDKTVTRNPTPFPKKVKRVVKPKLFEKSKK